MAVTKNPAALEHLCMLVRRDFGVPFLFFSPVAARKLDHVQKQ